MYAGGVKWIAYVNGVVVKTETFAGAAVNAATITPSSTTTTVIGDATGNLTLGTAAVDDVRVFTAGGSAAALSAAP